MSADFQVTGKNPAALFTLKVHRGDGMALLGMNWKKGEPPQDFVGFAIEYKEPGGTKFFSVQNRIAFPGKLGEVNPNTMSSRLSPIQKFRWVHFPRNAEMAGDFIYRVTPVFMNSLDELSYGESQDAAIELRRETYPGKLNVTFTRGFVSSQAFVDRYGPAKEINKLLPKSAKTGLTFTSTHPKAKEALGWMGFEARHAILEVLDEAIADPSAKVGVVAYDLSEPDVVSRLEKLGSRARVIIDESGDHGEEDSGEAQAEKRLKISAGENNVIRQKLSALQHNKTIVVDGKKVKAAVCGSTNFTWRGFFVQANNAIILRGAKAVKPFFAAFEDYWKTGKDGKAAIFGATASAQFLDLGLSGINAQLGFSPYAKQNSQLKKVANDIAGTTSSLFYSLAFLHQTPGVIQDAIEKVTNDPNVFVYGISDRDVGGIEIQTPNGNVAPVFPEALVKNIPEPFKSEPTGLAGNFGNRMHHKFIVIDFDKPTARVYLGSYNFSIPADESNGENLLVFRNRRIATSFMIEALRIFDHYHFRVAQADAATAKKKLQLAKPPRKADEKAWWVKDYTDAVKIHDRKLFA